MKKVVLMKNRTGVNVPFVKIIFSLYLCVYCVPECKYDLLRFRNVVVYSTYLVVLLTLWLRLLKGRESAGELTVTKETIEFPANIF
jgi:CRISPR/Cas system-associated protein endoribonuclease Cas2